MQVTTLFASKRIPRIFATVFIIALLVAPNFSHVAQAATAKEIDVSVEVALVRFKNEVRGANEFLANAKGVLVIPNVIRVGFGLGGEYGEGAMIIGGKTVDRLHGVQLTVFHLPACQRDQRKGNSFRDQSVLVVLVVL